MASVADICPEGPVTGALPHPDDLRLPFGLRSDLVRLRADGPDVFKALFSDGHPIDAHLIEGYAGLVHSGLVQARAGRVRSLFRLFEHGPLFVLSDWKGMDSRRLRAESSSTGSSGGASRRPPAGEANSSEIFRPRTEEVRITAPFFLPSPSEHRVLDVGCGSGIYAMAAALSGARVLGIDCNERALAAARYGRALNGLCDQTTFRRGDLYEGTAGEFDLVLLALPYQPTPPTIRGKVYANGGPTGLALFERALRGVGARLRPGGQAKASLMSLGGDVGTLIESRVGGWLPPGKWDVRCERVGDAIPFRGWWHAKGDPPSDGVKVWLDELDRVGLTHLSRVRLTVRFLG